MLRSYDPSYNEEPSTESSSSSDDGFSSSPSKLDLSYQSLGAGSLENLLRDEDGDTSRDNLLEKLLIYNNLLERLPEKVFTFENLQILDASNNLLMNVPSSIEKLVNLTSLHLRNNCLTSESFPKNLKKLANMRDLNLSGNRLDEIPPQIFQLTSLRNLYLGGNAIREIPRDVIFLPKLRVFYLGGNRITELPKEICKLRHLHALILCSNALSSLPECICSLEKLECLQLHQNCLTTLPIGLIHLKSLKELSLRDNPLIHRFVNEMDYQPSSLLELSARFIKTESLPFRASDLPRTLISYLNTANCCLNPSCKGVYFESRVEHVKFVDFCGKYKIPLLQYLCSSKCKDGNPASPSNNSTLEEKKMRRVLLG